MTAGTGRGGAGTAGRAGWLARLASRLPRRTIRLRLTMLYGVLFLVSGAGLLALTNLLVATNLPMELRVVSGTAAPGQLPPSPRAPAASRGGPPAGRLPREAGPAGDPGSGDGLQAGQLAG